MPVPDYENDLVFPPRHDKTAYELQLENNKLRSLLRECKEFFEEENPKDFTIMSERMDELLTRINAVLGESEE